MAFCIMQRAIFYTLKRKEESNLIYSILASILIITALVLFFDLTPERVTDDILQIITPKDSMKERAKNLRGNRKRHRLYRALMKFKTALAATGKSKQFTLVCFASVFLFGAGIIFSILINNIYLAPVLAIPPLERAFLLLTACWFLAQVPSSVSLP